jgi:hypothetical protein
MCTSISHQAALEGSAKGPTGWFAIDRVHVGYDHPVHASAEHAVLVDVVDDAGNRVALELSRDATRQLAARLLAAVADADIHEAAGT